MGSCGGLRWVAAVWLCASVGALAETEPDTEGSAFVGRQPSESEQAFEEDRRTAARDYASCLLEASDTWFTTPDYLSCDGLRAAYEQFLPAEIAPVAVGCLEEGVLGSPRIAEHTCSAVRAKFPIVVSHFEDEEASP